MAGLALGIPHPEVIGNKGEAEIINFPSLSGSSRSGYPEWRGVNSFIGWPFPKTFHLRYSGSILLVKKNRNHIMLIHARSQRRLGNAI